MSLFKPRMTLRGSLSLLVVLLAAIPLVFVVYSSLQLDADG
ncbi:hypothetical protein [Thiohalophilus sp.]|nr:hypothetical protein [Thiohalophilus sp.]MDZ7661988.1 hypothetical protein [Thiohalophilus sp.]